MWLIGEEKVFTKKLFFAIRRSDAIVKYPLVYFKEFIRIL